MPTGMTEPISLQALLTGSVRPFGPRGVGSGIAKTPMTEPVYLGRFGFDGDAQGDGKHHGGPEKAVHHYPFEHYAHWQAQIGPRDVLAQPGAFGENLSTLGLTEETTAIGDVFRLGAAVIEVSQGRQPCWKLNLRFDQPDMALRVQRSGRTGWYYRVLEEGVVAPGDHPIRLDRRIPDWPLHRFWRLLYIDTMNREELRAMANLPGLPENWLRLAERRLATGQVEDWSPRLHDRERPDASRLP